ncbi:MAG: 3-phosphoshikimate 1-carboxyvinyltransferase, partial [Halobacteria archaeon]|nr:3-phosphoshikimate 1-carboxyvinyltransferase [Halobacteria archaeon]
MELRVSNSDVEGHVDAPPSKSYTHRAVLAGGLADETRVVNPLRSADTRASVRCTKGLGAEITDDEGDLVVEGVEGEPEVPDDVLNCANSGTTLRLFAGASSLADGTTVLTGDSSLRERPNGPLLDALESLGGRANSTRSNGRAPLVVEGRIDGGEVSIDGTVSSQFISSLLLATPPTEEGARIEVVGGLKSRPYVEITLEVLDSFGVECEEDGEEFRLGGGQEYSVEGGEYRVPGDFSSASYPLAAGGVAGGEVEVGNLYPSAQGDSVIVDVLDRMGADVSWDRESGVVTCPDCGWSSGGGDGGDDHSGE